MNSLDYSRLTVGLLFVLGPLSAHGGQRSLSDYGGDVSQYMGILKDSSAFSFRPGSDSGMMARDVSSPKKSPGEDFGGDYGDYLNLLQGASALGFNPQSDVVASNQDLQTDVFGGGGMSGKFWDAYKGKSSFDSLDAEDADLVEELDITDDEEEDNEYKNKYAQRQAGEVDQPEDRGKQQRESARLTEAIRKAKTALLSVDQKKMDDFLKAINAQDPYDKMGGGKKMLIQRWDNSGFDFGNSNPTFKSDGVSKKDPVNYYQKELPQSQDLETRREARDQAELPAVGRVESSIVDIVSKVTSSFPDPLVARRNANMNFHNLTLYGLSQLHMCDKTDVSKTKSDKFVAILCVDNLSVTVDSVAGPGVPFKGRIVAIFKQPRIKVTVKERGEGVVHVVSVHVESKSTKFVPTYDSSIPLNPWSKISMSGYLVAKVRKTLPKVVDRTIAKIMHEAEKM